MRPTSGWRQQSLLYLIGIFFLYFSNGTQAWAIAPWIALPCLLIVTRQQRPWITYWLMAITFGVITQASLWHFTTQDATQLLHYIPLGSGLLFGIPYALDAAVFRRKTTSGSQTLLFPLAYTSLDYAVGSLNPYGSMGLLPYSQLDFLAIAQVVSVTGLWGLTFLIAWFGSVAAYAFTRYVTDRLIGRVVVLYAVIWGLVIAFGSWRLSQRPLSSMARVAGLHVCDREKLGRLWKSYSASPATFRASADSILEQLTAATRQQARAGAQVVIWSEVSPPMLAADEPRLLDSLKKLARNERIYLVASPYIYEHPVRKDQNKLWLIDPAGHLAITHYKYGGNLFEGCVKGNEQLQATDTPLGRLSGVICWDGDFPQTIRQVSALRAGLLLIPAADWQAINPLHTVVAQFRGIENGCSVVRQTLSGRSVMADPYGRVITQMDHFTTTRWVMQGQVPTQFVPTLYGLMGDWFAWLCVAGLGVFKGFWNRRSGPL